MSESKEGRFKYSFKHQFVAVFEKNWIAQKRAYRTNACQLIFPVLILLLLLLLQSLTAGFTQEIKGQPHPTANGFFMSRAWELGLSRQSMAVSIPYSVASDAQDPGQLIVPGPTYIPIPGQPLPNPIPTPPPSPTKKGLLGNFTWSTFVTFGSYRINGPRFAPDTTPAPWLGSRNPFMDSQLQLRFDKVDSRSKINEQLYANWSTPEALTAYEFKKYGGNEISYNLFFNGSQLSLRTSGKPSLGFEVSSLASMMNAAVFKTLFPTVNPNVTLTTQWRGFPTEDFTSTLDLVSIVGPLFFTFILHFLFPVFAGTLVAEKELNLRENMRMMGMETKVYFLVNYLWDMTMYLVVMGLFWLLSAIFEFRFITQNGGGALFLLFFLWGNAMTAMSFFFSVFFTKTKTATVSAYFALIGLVIVGNSLNADLADPTTADGLTVALTSLIPTFVFNRGIQYFTGSILNNGPGLSLATFNASIYPMTEVYLYLLFETIGYILLALYLDAVLPSGTGVPKKPLFFLEKEFWTGSGAHQLFSADPEQNDPEMMEMVAALPADIRAERLEALKYPEKYAAVVQGLSKTFPAANGNPPFTAVKPTFLTFKRGQCTGVLGPNGAGKSTLINMMAGFFSPSTGTGVVQGMDIRQDMDIIHRMMGVCPQHDVLWLELTAREHLRFYGRLKNLVGQELEDAIERSLESVKLVDAGDMKAGEYSGGMKRRLSVAISLIGDPEVIFLDEPSTGLDPASQQDLWNVINAYKENHCVVLTTHSMEEADALCDRIAIMASGALQCMGESETLKKRYASGYKFAAVTKPGEEQKAIDLVQELFGSEAKMLHAPLAGRMDWDVPSAAVTVSEVFRVMLNGQEEKGILDFGLSQSTLEEVFLSIAEATEDDR